MRDFSGSRLEDRPLGSSGIVLRKVCDGLEELGAALIGGRALSPQMMSRRKAETKVSSEVVIDLS